MYGSIDYLTRQATFKQVSPTYPITQEIEGSTEDPAIFEETKKDLVTDLLRKAKQIEYLIDALPIPSDGAVQLGKPEQDLEKDKTDETAEEDRDSEFVELESELKTVNEEFLDALKQAAELQNQLESTLHNMLNEHHHLSQNLVAVS